jgi:hypothetical protein
MGERVGIEGDQPGQDGIEGEFHILECRIGSMTRGQDILLVLKLQALALDEEAPRTWTFASLGESIGLSASQAYAAFQRAEAARLVRQDRTVRSHALYQALKHIQYFLPAKLGGIKRGIPTAHAALPLSELIQASGAYDLAPAWPSPDGTVRGQELEPIYKTAPQAALADPNLYKLLALVDSMRIGNTRERNLAEEELAKLLRIEQTSGNND